MSDFVFTGPAFQGARPDQQQERREPAFTFSGPAFQSPPSAEGQPLPLPPEPIEPPLGPRARFSESPFVTPEITPRPVENVIQQEPYAGGEGAFDQPVTNPNIARQAARARGVQMSRPEPPKFEDLPTLIELPEAQDPRNFTLFAGLPFARTAEGRQNIVVSNLPGAKAGEDAFGNPIVEYQGQRYHVDRPDKINMQDITYGAFSAAPSMLLGGVTGAALRPAGALLQSAGQGLAGFGSGLLGQYFGRQAGSEEEYNFPAAILEGGLGAALHLPTTARPSTREFRSLPAGTQRELINRGVFRPEEALSPGEMILDTPEGVALARSIISNIRRPAVTEELQKPIETALTSRAQGRIAQISREVDDTLGPLQGRAGEILEGLQKDKEQLNIQLGRALDNSPPITNIQSVLDYIDNIKNTQYSQASSVQNFLDHARSLLTKPDGTPLTNARMIQNALNEIDEGIKKGGTYTVRSGPNITQVQYPSIAPNDVAARQIRRDLSNALKAENKNYAQIMADYPDYYGTREAVEKALGLFDNRLSLEEARKFLADPLTRDEVKSALRAAIQNNLERDASLVTNVRRGAGAEHSAKRQILEEAFGKEAVDNFANIANRHAQQQRTEALTPQLRAAGAERAATDIARRMDQGPIDTSAPFGIGQLLRNIAYAYPINLAGRLITGGVSPATMRGYSDFLLSSGDRARAMMEGLEKARTARRGQTSVDFAKPALPSQVAREAEDRTEQPQRFAGGRVGRASGGRLVRNDHSARAAALIRAADAAKKAHNDTTKEILEQPDEAVAKALSIANQAI